jgi:hypothetical protein
MVLAQWMGRGAPCVRNHCRALVFSKTLRIIFKEMLLFAVGELSSDS